jgi:hypothetical protein
LVGSDFQVDGLLCGRSELSPQLHQEQRDGLQ